jgi:hypothetical protein
VSFPIYGIYGEKIEQNSVHVDLIQYFLYFTAFYILLIIFCDLPYLKLKGQSHEKKWQDKCMGS